MEASLYGPLACMGGSGQSLIMPPLPCPPLVLHAGWQTPTEPEE